MAEYRRAWLPGATWFFSMNLAERRGSRLLVERIDVLRTAFRSVVSDSCEPEPTTTTCGPCVGFRQCSDGTRIPCSVA